MPLAIYSPLSPMDHPYAYGIGLEGETVEVIAEPKRNGLSFLLAISSEKVPGITVHRHLFLGSWDATRRFATQFV